MSSATTATGSSPCSLCTCDPKDVPLALRQHDVVGDPALDLTLPTTTTTTTTTTESASTSAPEATDFFYPFHQQQQKEKLEEPKSNKVDVTEDYELVDLVRNPAANTGYAGPQANRVWEAIYRENCFVGTTTNSDSDVQQW